MNIAIEIRVAFKVIQTENKWNEENKRGIITNLEQDLCDEMLNLYKTAKNKCNYDAKRFIQMLSEHGALQTAKILINSSLFNNSISGPGFSSRS